MKKRFLTILLSCFLLTTFGQHVFDSCLVAYYPFDGNTMDKTGNGHHGIAYGNPILTENRFGQDSSAYSFDGIDDFIEIANNNDLNPEITTLCVCYKTISFEGIGNNAIIDKPFLWHTEPYYQYHIGVVGDLYTHQGRARFQTDLSVDTTRIKYFTENNFWTANTWYFICMTYDGNFFKTYINGELYNLIKLSGVLPNFGRNIYIGKFGNIDAFTPGIIDDIRIYNCALDSISIKELFQENPTSINLIKDFKLKLYPNPTVGIINIKSEVKIRKVSVVNYLGITVLNISGNIETLDLSIFPNGLYISHLYDENNNLIKTAKIIKN